MIIEELRIGNYVDYEATTHIITGLYGQTIQSWWVNKGKPVIEMIPKDISGVKVPDYYLDSIENHKPIVLTDEWFEKFNYKLSDNGEFTLRKASAGRYDVLLGEYYLTSLQYIHEYQNLCFDLFGNLLILKDESN